MGTADYYSLLGVPRGASQEEIARAYRQKAREFHPDLHPPNRAEWAEERMKELNAAYEVLGDRSRRSEYDRRYWGSPAPARRTSTKRAHPRRRPTIRVAPLVVKAVDVLSAAYLVVGGIVIAVLIWPLLQTYDSMVTHPYHWLALVVWFALLGRLLFRILPFARLR
jgi:preprotein translocase subunit Sec63